MVTMCVSQPAPKCKHIGCTNDVVATKHFYDQARRRIKTAWRNVCAKCHENHLAERNNTTYTKLCHQWHPYLWARKDYCENQDGRLGFTCNTVLPTPEMLLAAGLKWTPDQFLHVDHKDGFSKRNDEIDPNRPENLQTLCSHCHTIKGIQNGDHLTPGRKTYKLLT